MPVAGNIIKQPWLFLDTDMSTPLTGATTPADITFALKRYTAAGTVSATETVTFPELGLGFYDITFTPENSGLYSVFLQEISGAARGWLFTWEVVASGAVYSPSFANAFCAETDVERWLQYSIDSTTAPTDTETAGFAQTRAAVLMSLCARLGYTVTPSTVTAGSRIETLLRDANAIGAAMDYTIAQQMRITPNKTDRIELLMARWVEYAGGPQPGVSKEAVGLIEKEITGTLVSLATDHILSGDTLAAPSSSSPPTDAGITVTMGTLY